MRYLLTRSAVALFITGSLAASGASLAQEQNPPEESTQEQLPSQRGQGQQLPPGQVAAVLKSREADFIYRSSNSVLACDELRNRVATILREVGARDDVQVTARECDAFVTPSSRGPRRSDPRVSGTFQPGTGGDITGGNDDLMKRPIDRQMERRETLTHGDRYDRYKTQTTPVHIEVMVPVVITPEILDEVERDKARRALVSRVQGNKSAVMDDPIFFAAERREVKLSHDTIELEPIDCELLDQMTHTVFRQLDLKVKNSALACDSRSSLRPQLTVEALLPVGFLMPGEQRAKKRADEKEQRKAQQEPSQ
ncbi:MAG TPA: hypothetical protein VGQ22_07680 [Steroidobacteraceae bacterium]|jgi:hypothetical protein|nr:hypothetical protein [Steroidobacteraceae bacterium]